MPKVARLTLNSLCAELGVRTAVARDRLRTAARQPKHFPAIAKVHKPRQPWEWPKGSATEKEARMVLTLAASELAKA